MTAIIILNLLFTFLCILFGIQAGARLRARQKQRIAGYKNSPESHLLHLND